MATYVAELTLYTFIIACVAMLICILVVASLMILIIFVLATRRQQQKSSKKKPSNSKPRVKSRSQSSKKKNKSRKVKKKKKKKPMEKRPSDRQGEMYPWPSDEMNAERNDVHSITASPQMSSVRDQHTQSDSRPVMVDAYRGGVTDRESFSMKEAAQQPKSGKEGYVLVKKPRREVSTPPSRTDTKASTPGPQAEYEQPDDDDSDTGDSESPVSRPPPRAPPRSRSRPPPTPKREKIGEVDDLLNASQSEKVPRAFQQAAVLQPKVVDRDRSEQRIPTREDSYTAKSFSNPRVVSASQQYLQYPGTSPSYRTAKDRQSYQTAKEQQYTPPVSPHYVPSFESAVVATKRDIAGLPHRKPGGDEEGTDQDDTRGDDDTLLDDQDTLWWDGRDTLQDKQGTLFDDHDTLQDQDHQTTLLDMERYEEDLTDLVVKWEDKPAGISDHVVLDLDHYLSQNYTSCSSHEAHNSTVQCTEAEDSEATM